MPSPRSCLAAVLLAAGLSGCQSVRYVEAFHPEGAIYRVELTVDSGDVRLQAGDRLRVERAIKAPEGALALSHHIREGVLILEASCSSFAPCAVDTVLDIPAGLPVAVNLGEGTIEVDGLRSVDVRLDRGSVSVMDAERVVVRVGEGTVDAELGGTASATISVAKGDIHLGLGADAWRLAVTAHHLQLQGVASDDDAPGVLELMAPGGTVELHRSEAVGVVAMGMSRD